MNKKICFFIFLFFPALFFAQPNVNSLELLSQSQNKDEAWVDKMIIEVGDIINSNPKLAVEYTKTILNISKKLSYENGISNSLIKNAAALNVLGKYDEAKKQIDIALKSIPDNNSIDKAKALILLGKVNYNLGSYDSALLIYDKAEKLTKSNVKSIQHAEIYNNRANVYVLKGDNKLAIENYINAAEIYQYLDEKQLLAIVYTNLGNSNANFKLYDKSIEYFKKAAEINKTYNDLSNLSINFLNMGVSYKEMDSLNKATTYYEKSLAIAKNLGSNLVMAQNYSNLANIYEKKGDHKKALSFYNSSLDICKKEKIPYGLALNYASIGETYFFLKNYKVAIINLNRALDYTKKLGIPKEQSKVYETLTKVHKAMGDYKNAFYFQSLFKQINDSLVNIEKHKQIVELQIKYDTAEKQKTISEMDVKQISQKLTIGYLFSLSLLLILLSLWFFYRKKQSLQEKKIAEVIADKMKLELDIKNNELAHKTLNISHLQENNKLIASDVEEILKLSKVSNIEINQLVRKIKSSSENINIWDEFDHRFKEIHGIFHSKVIAMYPDLSPVELRIVSLLRLNLTTKEIAEIMQRSIKTVENTRGIIRKKMKLDKNINLTSFILSFK
ncbi:tetratricopeptide repeat protein [Flavobacterium sp. W22_SRS_FP1]|uniref:tetratricopeptide repeat protein n=1 Tax=Flavobacterium sp. W22_SRS_FP1 TaxID=3240276 RepID=UPI003F9217A1